MPGALPCDDAMMSIVSLNTIFWSHDNMQIAPSDDYAGNDHRAKIGGPWREKLRYRIEAVDHPTFFPGRYGENNECGASSLFLSGD